MKFLKSKTFLICLAIVLVVALLTAVLSMLGWTGPIRLVLKTVAKPFEWIGSRTADSVNGFVAVFTEYDRLQKENQALKEELESLKEDAYDADQLREENAWLKEYLLLMGDHPEIDLTDARIVGREAGNYSTVLTLNRGFVHGVRQKMPVITEDGLFGSVAEVGLDWCKVVSIIESDSSVGAYTERTGALGVVKGELSLRGEGVCGMQYVKDAEIRLGDRVYTSGGSESIYPSGLLIGEITSIEADSVGLTVVVQPAVNFTEIDQISRLMVICGYESEE